jgi:hypothetical protein
MNSEEKLNHLFASLKAEKASTSVADVTTWIQASAQVSAPKSTSKSIIQKNFFIMSTIVTTLIVGGFLFLSGNKESKRTPPQNNTTKEAIMDTSASIVKQANQLPVNKEFSENPFIQPLIDLGIKPLPFMEIVNSPAINQLDPIRSTQYSPRTNNQSNAGSWLSSNDSLFVDTLFSGVKSLVFKGDKCDLLVRGTERSDISMKYHYQLKTKGVFKRKKESNCELSYELKDSVLTIHLQRENQKFNGISILSESSKMEFIVPENVDVKMDSDLGDIDVDGLNNISSVFHSSLGDITTTNSTGVIDIETALGDILIKNVSGKLKLVTSMGDISCENIGISDDCILNSSMGDIDVQLNNPISECKLNLSTSMGKVKMKRADLTTKSRNELKTNSGKFKVNMNTSMGNIIVR